MKQVIEDYRSGALSVAEVAAPSCRPGTVLVQNRASLISAGTEGASLRFGQQSLVRKALSKPDLARQVIDRVRSQGLRATYQLVQARLDVPLALGYSCAGDVLEVGSGVGGLRTGDRVACAGGGYASHAEVVGVPRNLVVRVPDGVSEEEGAFATVGAIALQGLRVADVRVGERVVVIGLGLIGLLTVQLLKASGCRVLGSDPNPARATLARDLGANEAYAADPAAIAEAVGAFTSGRGADAVIITAATRSNGPIELAGEVSRQNGRVVVVGDVRMDVPRRTYYEKELELRVSRSYGPGRYDPSYEEKGIDYPYPYVPFTEQRNMEAFLQLVAEGSVTPGRLITHRFPIEEAERAYALIKGEVSEPHLGVLFTYAAAPDLRRRIPCASVPGARCPVPGGTKTGPSPTGHRAPGTGHRSEATVRVGVIGAGNYARLMLLPRLAAMRDVRLVGVATSRGVTAGDAAKRFGFEFAATDPREVLEDDRIDLVVIATRHDSHAALAAAALAAGKHVFVEKPLATNEEDLRLVLAAAEQAERHLMVGFNRRFAPLVRQAWDKLQERAQPLAMLYRVNAGALPASHWTQDPQEGGGRIIGEVCHFIDLLQYLCGSAPASVFAASASGDTGSVPPEEIATITLRFADGSLGTIAYFANGHRAVPKEYLELYGGGRTLILEDFRRARWAEGSTVARWKSREQDKGQSGELQALLQAIRTGAPTPIPLAQAVLTTLASFRTLDSLRSGREVPVHWTRI